MNLLNSYLSRSKVKKVLSTKPGDEGFSLIELVVVVAVLAILSAVAIPNFADITQKARAAAASNTLATVIKECQVKFANGETAPTFVQPSLDGYSYIESGGSQTDCARAGTTAVTTTSGSGSSQTTTTTNVVNTYQAVSSDLAYLPTFIYNPGTGEKTCTVDTGMDADTRIRVGCTSATNAGATGNW